MFGYITFKGNYHEDRISLGGERIGECQHTAHLNNLAQQMHVLSLPPVADGYSPAYETLEPLSASLNLGHACLKTNCKIADARV